MNKIITLLLIIISLNSFSQDEFYRVVDWAFIPDSVVQLTDSTYILKAEPINFSDPGAIQRTVGNYIVDYVGRRYQVIDSTLTTITVKDIYDTGQAPQALREARCYRSAVYGKYPFVGSVDYSVLDPSSRWRLNGSDNELLARGIDSLNTIKLENPVDSIVFNPDVAPIPSTNYTMYADTTDRTLSVNLGNGVVMQINQETLIRVYNNTADTIMDGRVCFGSGINGNAITIALASKADRHSALVITTEAIAPNSYGLCVELGGKVRGVDVGTATPGPIYLDTMGYVSNSQGVFPDYNYPLGAIIQKNGTAVIQFRASDVSFLNSIDNIMDGSIRETFDFRTFSDGVNSYGVLSNPTGDTTLTLVFSTGWVDHIVPDTVTLIDGAIDDPQLQYVFIDELTKTLQVSSGSYPTDEHCKVSTMALLTSSQTQSDGALRNQNINDHFKSDDDNGHILHMAERIRTLDAKWESGVAPTLTGTPTNVYFQTTGGTVWQMHLQIFPAQDMSTGDDVHVVNDFDTPYRTTTNLNDITEFSDGSSWNNEWSNIVLWGVCNKSGEISHLMVNLPSDGYQQESSAIQDALNYTDYSIPRDFRGVGFLIGRFTIRRSGGNFTYNSATGFQDLRGFVPNTTVGGGPGGGAAVTEWTQLNDIPNSYVGFGEAIVTIASAETGAEFTPRANIQLEDFDKTGFQWGLDDVTAVNPVTSDAITFNGGTSNDNISLNTTPTLDPHLVNIDYLENTFAPSLVNPTTGFIPYNFDGVSFGDSRIYTDGANTIVNPLSNLSGATTLQVGLSTNTARNSVNSVDNAQISTMTNSEFYNGIRVVGGEYNVGSYIYIDLFGTLAKNASFNAGHRISSIGGSSAITENQYLSFNKISYDNIDSITVTEIARFSEDDEFLLGYTVSQGNYILQANGNALINGETEIAAGATVADAPVVNTDVLRKVDVENASLDADFNSVSISGDDILGIISDSIPDLTNYTQKNVSETITSGWTFDTDITLNNGTFPFDNSVITKKYADDNYLSSGNVVFTDVTTQTISTSGSTSLTLKTTDGTETVFYGLKDQANVTKIALGYDTNLDYGYLQYGEDFEFLADGITTQGEIINSTGQWVFNNYTSPTSFTGTAIANLQVDASGKIITTAVPAVGTTDYINAGSFNTGSGVVTLTGVGSAGASYDLDGRYVETAVSNGGLGKSSNNLYMSIANTADLSLSLDLADYIFVKDGTSGTNMGSVQLQDVKDLFGTGGVSFGNQYEIPITNAAGDDFDYVTGFRFINGEIQGADRIKLNDQVDFIGELSGVTQLSTGGSMWVNSGNKKLYFSNTTLGDVDLINGVFFQTIDWEFSGTRDFDARDGNTAETDINSTAGLQVNIDYLQEGDKGQILLNVGANAPTTFTINAYNDNTTTGLNEIFVGDALSLTSNKSTVIRYTCFDDSSGGSVLIEILNEN